MASDAVMYEALLDHLRDGVYFVGNDHAINYWNAGAERITGHTREDLLGKTLAPQILGHVDREGAPIYNGNHPLELCLLDGQTREAELYLKHKDGSLVPVFTRISPIENSMGQIIGAMEVFSDNSARVQTLQRIEELEEMALVDPLTEVGNRRYAEMSLKNAFEELTRFNWTFGVLFIDIDHFKEVNDTHGHSLGDEILRMTAHALRATLRTIDFVGRWGGEEFIALLPNVNDDILLTIAERCRESVGNAIFQHEGRTIRVTVSIGAAIARLDETAEQCVSRADRLMYKAKQSGRNRVTIEDAS